MTKRIVLGVFVVIVLVGAIFYSQMQSSEPFVSGMIETDEIRLGSRVGGRVKAVLIDEGDRVSAGQPLIEFEPYDLLELERKAIAELAVRVADLERLKSGPRPEEIEQAKSRVEQLGSQLTLLELGPRQEEIDAAQQRLNAAEAELLLARREFDRRSKLIQSNAVSQGELDTANERFDAARANVQVKRNELAILKAGARQPELDQARAKVNEAELEWEIAKQGYRTELIEQAEAARDAAAAALEVVRQQKTELTIIAPADGVVDALDLQPGDLVGPNAPVLTVLSDQHVWVRAYVPQEYLKLSVGQELRISIDSMPEKDFFGEVSFISHQAEFTPSNVQTVDDRSKQVYRIRVNLKVQTGLLRPGMTANVWLTPVNRGGSK